MSESLIRAWENDQPIPSVHKAIGELTLTPEDRQLLEGAMVEKDQSWLIEPDGSLHERLAGAAPDVARVLHRTLQDFLGVVRADLEGAGIDRPFESLVVTANIYDRLDGSEKPHVDGGHRGYADLVRYVAAPIGPSTLFAEGLFKRSDFDRHGSMINPQMVERWTQYSEGTVVGFLGGTPHRKPDLEIPPGPRLFFSVAVDPGVR